MSALLAVVVIAAVNAFAILSSVKAYREGWDHGYGAGYDDRDDETIYGEKPGTRNGRTNR